MPGGFVTMMAYRIRHNFLHCVLFCYNLYNLRGLIMGLFCVIVTRYRGNYVTVESFVFQLWGSDQELKLIFIQM